MTPAERVTLILTMLVVVPWATLLLCLALSPSLRWYGVLLGDMHRSGVRRRARAHALAAIEAIRCHFMLVLVVALGKVATLFPARKPACVMLVRYLFDWHERRMERFWRRVE